MPNAESDPIYQSYVRFEDENLVMSLENVQSGFVQDEYLSKHHVMSKEEFYIWLDSLAPNIKAMYLRRFEQGYAKYIEDETKKFNERMRKPGYIAWLLNR
ncbi:hypothetical protein A3D88_04710 [Candidatus Peribacteria bacterium RIFCSPHIGHO2_02_FULL_52_16]|nr:MAG: hypothetical protein A2706_03340 [Candidatus Peribacteria bacterium RIFCSPHIGHO2_01_FULL_51_35]OGJ60903.1 MAG: hypothetical protein A3D88_04710 [Candidatus Peribacteria bacterium RIFCSPHIGHO2_02_FULL_52_16]